MALPLQPTQCPMRKTTHSASSGSAGIVRRAWTSGLAAVKPQIPASFEGDTSCRQVFDVLDGRLIIAANQPWQVTVYAVVDDGISRWVQMTVAGKMVNEVTIRIGSGEGSKPVIRALAQWLNTTHQDDPQVPEIVSTARCA